MQTDKNLKKQCLKEILRNPCMFQSIIKHFANICSISDILYAINRADGNSEILGKGQSVMQVFYGTGFDSKSVGWDGGANAHLPPFFRRPSIEN